MKLNEIVKHKTKHSDHRHIIYFENMILKFQSTTKSLINNSRSIDGIFKLLKTFFFILNYYCWKLIVASCKHINTIESHTFMLGYCDMIDCSVGVQSRPIL